MALSCARTAFAVEHSMKLLPQSEMTSALESIALGMLRSLCNIHRCSMLEAAMDLLLGFLT